MEPFFVLCTTCKSRLRVRSAKVIGQIHSCPKCGSMVLIQRESSASPTSTSPAGSSAATSQTSAQSSNKSLSPTSKSSANQSLAQDDPDHSKAQLGDATVQSSSLQQAVENNHPPNNLAEIKHHTSTVSTGPALSNEPFEKTAELPEKGLHSSVPGGPVIPDAHWSSPAELIWKKWAAYGSATIAGIVLATGISTWLVSKNTPQIKPAVDPTGEHASSEATQNTRPTKKEPGASATKTQTPQDVESKAPLTESAPSHRPIETPPEFPDSVISDPEPNTSQDIINPQSDVTAATSTTASNPSSASTTTYPLETDAPTDTSPVQSEVIEMESLSIPPEPQLSIPSIDVESHLVIPIPNINFTSVSLGDFLAFISNLSNLPITVSPELLMYTGVELETPFSLQYENATVGIVLGDGLAHLKLGYMINNTGVEIIQPPSRSHGLHRQRYSMADLRTAKGSSLDQLAVNFQQLVAPQSWETSGGFAKFLVLSNQWVVDQTSENQFQLLVLCEKLRCARGLQPRSQMNSGLVQLTTRTEQASEKLALLVSVNFTTPTRLENIFKEIGNQAGVDIFVNWTELAQSGIAFATEKKFRSLKQPLERTLEQLLTPMGLAYRCVDAKRLQITSINSLHNKLELEVYSSHHWLGPDPSPTDRLLQIRATLQLPGSKLPLGSTFYIDPPSRCLIARLPQPYQRRLITILKENLQSQKHS